MKYLKAGNRVHLWGFVALNLLVFWFIILGDAFNTSLLDARWAFLTGKTGAAAALIPLLTVVLAGVLSDNLKAALVFWRIRDPLPGCRAFSQVATLDPRIDLALIGKRLGSLPTEPREQNNLWYRLYRKHQGQTVVTESHRVYLLTRDMTSMACGFVLLLPLGSLCAAASLKTVGVYLAGLILQYVIVSRAAAHYGHRFAANVLVEESIAVAEGVGTAG